MEELFKFNIENFIQIQEPIFLALIFASFLLLIVLKTYFLASSPTIYLVDYSCFKPPNYWRIPFASFLEHSRLVHSLDQKTLDFMSKVLVSSGQSQTTSLPPSLHYIPPTSTHQDAISEAETLLFPVFEDLLTKTKLTPQDIDILITNCSGFCPSPSLSAIIVNKFSMREDIKSFNISGSGCSASALAVDMAQNLLKVHKNSNAVILSTEILSNGWYAGKTRPMMIINCIFRTGSAAILLTNKPSAKTVSKYRLIYSQRTQGAFDDTAHNCAVREEDNQGIPGVTLKPGALLMAGELLRTSFQVLGASILPLDEKIRYVVSIVRRKMFDKSMELYVPKFSKVIQHYCLPTSGKSVILEIGKRLKLKDEEIEAALMTMHRFGNQSSSALWYELAYIEGKERVKVGDKVLQLGLGSGTKCTGLVWKCIRPIVNEVHKGPWVDTLHNYPIQDRK